MTPGANMSYRAGLDIERSSCQFLVAAVQPARRRTVRASRNGRDLEAVRTAHASDTGRHGRSRCDEMVVDVTLGPAREYCQTLARLMASAGYRIRRADILIEQDGSLRCTSLLAHHRLGRLPSSCPLVGV